MEQTFPRRQVERSFRKFNDLVSDLFSAKFQTWGNTFTLLMTHCEQDAVMKVVTEPLRRNSMVNADKWYHDAMASMQGMVGSAQYKLSYDDDDRTALLYQFFILLETDKVSFTDFCIRMYGTIRHQDAVDTFNRELVLKFTREVTYRLDEILEDLGDSQDVPREAMVVFHYHDHSMNIHGNKGSNIATGGSSINNTTASYASSGDAAEALKALKPLIAEIAAVQRETVEAALAVLVEAVEKQAGSPEAVKQAAEAVASASPTLKERLTEIAKKIGMSVAGSSVFQGLKMAFGWH